jgi:hypothetical protein
LQAAALGDWTASVLIRLTASPTGTDYAWTISGDGSSELAANNYLASLRILTDRRMGVLWEHSAGTDVASETTTYKLPLYKWTLVTVVKSATTGPGPGGTCTVTWYINGYEVETTPGVVNASDGSSAVLRLGNNLATVPDRFPQADIDCFQFHAGVMDVDSIREDVRRLYLLPFHARTDAKVVTEDSTGVMRDLTNHNGLDWVDSVETVDEIDQACSTATIRLLREQGARSLAGFRTDTINNLTDATDVSSFAQLITEGRDIEVFTARLPLGLVATARDWVSAFKGAIDDIEEASGEAVVLNCRDQGGRLVDTYIEETITYGAPDPGSAVEGEMQFILDDNDSDTGNNSVAGLVSRTGSYAPLTLYTPTSPSWAVLEWKQRREGVLAALRTLAGQIGWECRYRWDPNPSAPQWRLTFYDPDRDRLDADVLFRPDDILEVTQFARSILGIRNVVRVVYPSSETAATTEAALRSALNIPVSYTIRMGWNDLDGEGARMTAYVEIQSDDSIALYDQRLFMEMAENSSSQIDSAFEAGKMAFGSLRDLEVAQLDKGITLPCMPEMELNDFVLFAPNAQLFSGVQRLAVKRLTHTIGDTATTQVQLRGKPSVGWKRWLRLETRAGNGRPGVVSPDDANADLAQGDLLKVVRNILDRTSYLKGGKFLQVRNPSFDAYASGKQHFPDAWSTTPAPQAFHGGAWLTDFESATDSITASLSLRLKDVNPSAQKAIVSDFIPINGARSVSGNRYRAFTFEATWKSTATSGAGGNGLEARFEFYDRDKVYIASESSSFASSAAAGTEWIFSKDEDVRVPAGGNAAAFVRIAMHMQRNIASDVLVDAVAFYQSALKLKLESSGRQAIAAPVAGYNRWQNIRLDDTTFMVNIGGANRPTPVWAGGVDGTGYGFLCNEAGRYRITCHCAADSNNGGRYISMRFRKNATYRATTGHLKVTAGTESGTPLGQGTIGETIPKNDAGYNLGTVQANIAFVTATVVVELSEGDIVTPEVWSANSDVQPIGRDRLASGSNQTPGTFFQVEQILTE